MPNAHAIRWVLYWALALAVAFLALVAAVPQAFAAEASSTTVSLSPVFDLIFNTLAVVLVPVLSLLARRYILRYFDLQDDKAAVAAVNAALEKGTSMALAKVRLAAKKIEDFEVQNAAIGTVANYALAQVPDAIVRFGLTPEQLRDMALARLEERINPKPIVAIDRPAPAS